LGLLEDTFAAAVDGGFRIGVGGGAMKVGAGLSRTFTKTVPICPKGLAEILRSNKAMITTCTDVYDEYLSIIIRNARRLKELSDNILDIGRIESQSMKLNKQRADIRSLILEAIQESIENQTSIINHNVKLMYNPNLKNDESNILLSVDKGRIIQVMTNVISNDTAFTKEGVISITKETRKEQDGSLVIVTIKDTGLGIDSQILPRLFTKFATRSEKGTGLGLCICKCIVEAHGGKMWGKIMMIKERHLVSACQLSLYSNS